jgi:hypothetical protein
MKVSNMSAGTPTMEPLSARIPSDLYLWLTQLTIDGATTNSDKLRVLLTQLKRQHDGAFDYSAANIWARDVTRRLRDAMVSIEGKSGQNSEVIATVLDFLVAALSSVLSKAPNDEGEAMHLEDVLVRRAFALSEALLRQATSHAASAYDGQVVRRHVGATLELAANVKNLQGG